MQEVGLLQSAEILCCQFVAVALDESTALVGYRLAVGIEHLEVSHTRGGHYHSVGIEQVAVDVGVEARHLVAAQVGNDADRPFVVEAVVLHRLRERAVAPCYVAHGQRVAHKCFYLVLPVVAALAHAHVSGPRVVACCQCLGCGVGWVHYVAAHPVPHEWLHLALESLRDGLLPGDACVHHARHFAEAEQHHAHLVEHLEAHSVVASTGRMRALGNHEVAGYVVSPQFLVVLHLPFVRQLAEEAVCRGCIHRLPLCHAGRQGAQVILIGAVGIVAKVVGEAHRHRSGIANAPAHTVAYIFHIAANHLAAAVHGKHTDGIACLEDGLQAVGDGTSAARGTVQTVFYAH